MKERGNRPTLGEALRSGAIVTALAVVVWLFAEAESLGQEQIPARVVFQPSSSATPQFLVRPAEGFDGDVTLDVRGGRAALIELSIELQRAIRLEPGNGLPRSEGEVNVELLEALTRVPALQRTGATIDYVRPPRVKVNLERLEEVRLLIELDASGMDVDGAVTITPSEATLRLPSSLAASLAPGTRVSAVLDASARESLAAGPQTIEATLVPPPAIEGQLGAALLTQTASVALTVSAPSGSKRYGSVPVQLLLPPVESDDYRVVLDEASQFIGVEISAPRATIELLETEGVTPVAVLMLSDLELASGLTEKRVTFAIVRDGVQEPLPASVSVIPERETVSFTIERRDTP